MLFILTRAGEQEVGRANKIYFWVGEGVLRKELVFFDCKMSILTVSPIEKLWERHMLFILMRAGEQEVGGVNQMYFWVGNGVLSEEIVFVWL